MYDATLDARKIIFIIFDFFISVFFCNGNNFFVIFQASLSEFMFFVFWVMCHSHLDLEEDNELSSAALQVAKLGGLPSSILPFPNFLLMKISLITESGWQYNYNVNTLHFTLMMWQVLFLYFRIVNLEVVQIGSKIGKSNIYQNIVSRQCRTVLVP